MISTTPLHIDLLTDQPHEIAVVSWLSWRQLEIILVNNGLAMLVLDETFGVFQVLKGTGHRA